MEWLLLILLVPYFIILLFIIYRNLKKIKNFIPVSSPSTYVSVVIACRNEEKNISLLLDRLTQQNYRSDIFEVIIVDDHSTDNTSKSALSFSHRLNLKVLKNNGSGKKAALSTGIERACGRLIIVTDADCIMDISWIRTISAFYEEKKSDMILGPVMLDSSPGLLGIFQELEFLSLQGITAGAAAAGHATMCNGANLAYTQEVFLENKKNLRFDVATGDDVFLLHSLKKQVNSKICWLESTESMVVTSPSSSLKEYFNQRKRWISKSTAYKDPFSILLGFATFFAISLQAYTMMASTYQPSYLKIFISVLILKSIPDYLILHNTTTRYGKQRLMSWFLPSQLIYPFYVLSVTAYSFLFPGKKNLLTQINEKADQTKKL